MVHTRPQAHNVEGAVAVLDSVLEHHAVEVRILLSLDVAVELLVGLLQFVVRDLVRISEFLQVGDLLDHAVLHGAVKQFRRHVLADDLVFCVLDAGVDQGRMADGNDGVGANLTVAGFLNEALAGSRINHRAVTDSGFHKERSQTEAVFIGAGPRAELNPVHLDGVGTDHLSSLQSVARSTRMVGGAELLVQTRIVFHTHLDVLAEAAGGEQNTLGGAVVGNLAGLFTAEAIVFADLDAEHSALVVNNEVIDDRAQLHGDAVFLALLVHRVDEAGTGVIGHGMATGYGVTAVEGDGLELNTDLLEPFVVFNGAVGDVACEFGVSQTAACLHDVLVEEIGIVLDTGSLLHVGTGSGHGAAVDDGVAAVGRHLVDDEDVLDALFVGFNGSAQTGKTRTDNQEVNRFVPLGGNLHGLRKNGGRHNAGGTGGSQRAEEAAAGKTIGHFVSPSL